MSFVLVLCTEKHPVMLAEGAGFGSRPIDRLEIIYFFFLLVKIAITQKPKKNKNPIFTDIPPIKFQFAVQMHFSKYWLALQWVKGEISPIPPCIPVCAVIYFTK